MLPARKNKRPKVPARERGRERPMVSITLSPEAIEMLNQLADFRGMSRSATVEFLVREEGLRMRLDPKPRKPGATRFKR